MVRKLKHHEQKLLKKVDFISWSVDNNIHENKIISRYGIQKKEDYTTYNKLSRKIRELAKKVHDLNADSPFRTESSAKLLEKLYQMGLISTRWDLKLADSVTASSFCKRRLPVIMCKNKMAETIKTATRLIMHGHVRVGPELITNPSFLVSRSLEDFVTWVDSSSVKKHILKYNDELDDFDIM